jgi:hypothetical protein
MLTGIPMVRERMERTSRPVKALPIWGNLRRVYRTSFSNASGDSYKFRLSRDFLKWVRFVVRLVDSCDVFDGTQGVTERGHAILVSVPRETPVTSG